MRHMMEALSRTPRSARWVGLVEANVSECMSSTYIAAISVYAERAVHISSMIDPDPY